MATFRYDSAEVANIWIEKTLGMSTAMDLLRAAATGPEGLESFLQTHELTSQLAAEVRDVFVRSIHAGHLETAELAASVGAMLWLRLGNTHEMFRNVIDHLQVRFQLAHDAASYVAVRSSTLDVLSRVVSLQDDELGFRAAVLAADAAYFGHQVGGERLGLSIPLMLADLAAATNYAQRAAPSTWFPRFVGLTAAVAQRAMAEDLSEDQREQADRSLRHLAGEVASLRPTSRYFPEDPEKARQVDALLTALVSRYGS
jgi:hypothetical protein